MLKLETLKTTENTVWLPHDQFPDYHQAFCMIGFYKNQGYACVKIRQTDNNAHPFTIYVLRTKRSPNENV